MSHHLHLENGKASLFYVGDPPWHGLGQRLAGPATARQAMAAARLDWAVSKLPRDRCAMDDEGHPQLTHAIVKLDPASTLDGVTLGLVTEDYVPLQNREAFEFFDPIVGQDAAAYHTAGALGRGELVWILAKFPDSIRVAGDDVVDKYLLLTNSHTGQGRVQVRFTPVRVVCGNTLAAALAFGQGIQLEHGQDLPAQLAVAAQNLVLIRQRYEELAQAYQRMARVEMNSQSLSEYLNTVFPDPADPADEAGWDQARQARDLAADLFESGKGNSTPAAWRKLWAAYNAVTELVDHRQHHPTREARLRNVWFGDGYSVKVRAYEAALRQVQRRYLRGARPSVAFGAAPAFTEARTRSPRALESVGA
jgi:phage/plasmid-like protein (TIGR03299 family)